MRKDLRQQLATSATRLWHALRHVLDGSGVFEEQLTAIKRTGLRTLLVNAGVIAVIALAFQGSPLASWALGWSAAGFLLTAVSIALWSLERSGRLRERSRAKSARLITGFAGVRGLHWATGFLYLLPAASSALQLFLGWAIVGMICGGAFAYWTLPNAALVYVTIVGAGGMAGLFFTGEPAMMIASLTVVLFGSFLVRGAYANTALLRSHVEAERQLKENSETMGLLLKDFEEDSADWLWETGVDLKLKRGMSRFARGLGCEAGDVAGKTWCELMGPRAVNETQRLSLAKFKDLIHGGRAFRDAVISFGLPGMERWWQVSARPVFAHDGKLIGWRGVVSDVTAQNEAQGRIAYFAHYDSLTNLPNRMLFTEKFQQAFESGETAAGHHYAMYVDLDGFKEVNDTLGHHAGDLLLKAVARRLLELKREGDILSRHGGDEFALFCRFEEGDKAAVALAQKMVTLLSHPFDIGGQDVVIGASVGLARAGRDGRNLTELLRHADLALYRAKGSGRGQATLFEPSMDKRERDRQALKLDLRRALANGEFHLHFQPIVSTVDGEVKAYEALLRWQHPERGNIPPLNFIPLAEENGLIVDIGAWVIAEACRQAARWPNDLRVSVNLSAVQIKSPRLLPAAVKALADSRLLPHRLEFEITETALMGDKQAALSALGALKALGVGIALDDFGTGYSSLAYLHEFPFDKIKIDRSFVQSCESRRQSAAVINAVLRLAADLDMSTVAEGVETAEQLALLADKGCQEAQGYYLGRPQASESMQWAKQTAKLAS